MKRRYHLKSQANSPLFQKLTGIETFEVLGRGNCEIVKILSQIRLPIQRYAFGIFQENIDYAKNSCIKITPTCGILNCVKKDHLKAVYEPTKKDAQYIKDYLNIDGVDRLAHVFNAPISLLEDYLKTCS